MAKNDIMNERRNRHAGLDFRADPDADLRFFRIDDRFCAGGGITAGGQGTGAKR